MSEENKQTTTEELQSKLSEYEDRVKKMDSKIAELLNEAKSAKQLAKEKEEAARLAADEAARKTGDVDSLEKSWSEKLSKKEQEYKDRLSTYEKNARETYVDSEARRIAAEISTAPGLVFPHVKARLDMQTTEDGKFRTVVKDQNGSLSAMNLDELATEFRTNPDFVDVIKGTSANGGGAGGGDKKPAAKPGSREDKIARAKKAFGL